IGWLGHQDGVKAQMTPLETLRFFAQFPARDAGDAKERRIADALARADLARVRDLPVQYLSAGQKRRLALARLDVMERPLWLLDEPLAALDSAGKALAADYIREHCRAGGLVVAATHEPLGLEGKLLALGDAK
ncbi:MAG TPA: heme ABC exporter ATP-binding protein CcmA, partial [Rhizomicrobium sp.]|nr:heme ABC exporter ATP-binding protein CcmA [Rhizomicrobium sp.]